MPIQEIHKRFDLACTETKSLMRRMHSAIDELRKKCPEWDNELAIISQGCMQSQVKLKELSLLKTELSTITPDETNPADVQQLEFNTKMQSFLNQYNDQIEEQEQNLVRLKEISCKIESTNRFFPNVSSDALKQNNLSQSECQSISKLKNECTHKMN
ncbi:hypothetical protein TUM19329_22470 [Legionella antarctica]|uniref:Uncharacterized protein n=1 Tax=Legionella antarctica TaxID=2708020 RepID=A0A6F8T7E4_9GAMM|nr:hypothetical protein [Legionella antarctica]BCA95886.1 hypothetical protein TUM19329_22470 [Legionella antarctica]